MKNEHSLLIAALIGLAGFALTLTLLTLKTTKTAPTAPQVPAVKGRPRDERKPRTGDTDEDNERAVRDGLQLGDAVLEVQVLKVYQSSLRNTNLDIRVTNKSNKHIGFWAVSADLSGQDVSIWGTAGLTGTICDRGNRPQMILSTLI